MIKLLKCEYLKTRGRYVFITALAIIAAGLAWMMYGQHGDFIIENGWMSFLYRLPLLNTVIFPILSVIVSSRLCDIEHKGDMLKALATAASKGKIYDAKLIYGLIIVLFCIIISWAGTIIGGYVTGFHGSVPIGLYLLYMLFTVVPTIAVYIFQHTMSLLFKNQAVTFFAGIIGAFAGLFSMFLPMSWLRKILVWGWYGALHFVGLFGWTKETRYDNAYFAVTDRDWTFFAAAVGICVIMYFMGKWLFCGEEL